MARLRLFSDNTVDVSFNELIIYGFGNREYASLFLAKDEYMPINLMDEEDEVDIRVKRSNITVPSRADSENFEFKYLGTYPLGQNIM